MANPNVSVPMTKQDAYQMSLFAHMEICCNIMEKCAVPKSRRYNRLKNIQAQFEPINETFIGYLPQDWIDASAEFELKMQEQLNALLDRFTNGKPVAEQSAPQIPQTEVKSKVVKLTQEVVNMEELLVNIGTLMEAFKVDSAKAAAGNKSAGVRARKGSLAIAKELKVFRALSVAA